SQEECRCDQDDRLTNEPTHVEPPRPQTLPGSPGRKHSTSVSAARRLASRTVPTEWTDPASVHATGVSRCDSDPMMEAMTSPPDNRHPVNRAVAAKRAESLQLRLADAITSFAGSMTFVYAHIVVFALW